MTILGISQKKIYLLQIKNQVSIEDLEHHDLLRRDVHQLGSAFYQLNNAISNIPLSENGSHPGGYVFKLLEKANVSFSIDSISLNI